MFIDEAKIRVKAGGGGNGCVAFRREKYVPRGGPSGGDGGKGSDIYMESSERHNTLVHFRFNPEYKAQRGRHGEGANKTGREGEDIILKVPVGTILYDDETEIGRASCRERGWISVAGGPLEESVDAVYGLLGDFVLRLPRDGRVTVSSY